MTRIGITQENYRINADLSDMNTKMINPYNTSREPVVLSVNNDSITVPIAGYACIMVQTNAALSANTDVQVNVNGFQIATNMIKQQYEKTLVQIPVDAGDVISVVNLTNYQIRVTVYYPK